MVETDDRGRLYIEKPSTNGRKRFLVGTRRDRIELVHIDGDPLGRLRSAVGDAPEDYSTGELPDVARDEVRRRAGEQLR